MEKCRVLLSFVYISSVCPRKCALDGRLSTRSTRLYGVTSKKSDDIYNQRHQDIKAKQYLEFILIYLSIT